MTDDQSEVWREVQALNRAWTRGDVNDLARWFHEDMVAVTPTDRHRREGRAECIDGWRQFVNAAKIESFEEIAPKVQIYGVTAVVTYYYDMACELDGTLQRLAGRDMFVLVKENSRWWVVADSFSEFPEPTS